MRTTLRIDDQLFRAAKKSAAESGRTLTAVIEDALRQALAVRSPKKMASRFKLPVFETGETLPGVDFDDSAALLDLMESGDDPV